MARPTLMRHRKYIRLVAMLGSQPLARGVLEMIWDAGYESGDERLGGPAELEVVAGWTGEPGVLAEALVKCGFVDQAGPDDLRIHDLWHHAPDYVQKRRTRELARQRRVNPSAERQSVSAERRTESGQQTEISSEHSATLAPAPALARAPAPARAPDGGQAPPSVSAESVNAGGVWRTQSPLGAQRGGLIDGREQRRHGQHAWCDPAGGIPCIQASLHREFIGRLKAPDAHARLMAWYPTVAVKYADQAVGDDMFAFWRNEFAAWVGTVTAKPEPRRPGKGERTARAFDVASEALQNRGGL